MKLVKNFLRDEAGQDLIEYALLLAFICLFSAAVFVSVGREISGIWQAANETTKTANTIAQQGKATAE